MKKAAFALVLLAALLLSAASLAMTVEEVDPIRVANGFVVLDYGFAGADSGGGRSRSGR